MLIPGSAVSPSLCVCEKFLGMGGFLCFIHAPFYLCKFISFSNFSFLFLGNSFYMNFI